MWGTVRQQHPWGLTSAGSSGRQQYARRILNGHVDVFKEMAWSDTAQTVGGLDEVVAGPARMLAAEAVGEYERFSQLTGVHEEACAVDGP